MNVALGLLALHGMLPGPGADAAHYGVLADWLEERGFHDEAAILRRYPSYRDAYANDFEAMGCIAAAVGETVYPLHPGDSDGQWAVTIAVHTASNPVSVITVGPFKGVEDDEQETGGETDLSELHAEGGNATAVVPDVPV